MQNISKEELFELYINQNLSIKKISEKINVSKNKIGKLLKQYELSRGRGNYVTYIANHSFFENWSHNMAYCLGFIAGDGHVWKNRPLLSISIHMNDEEILKKIRDCISPQSKIRLNKNHNMIQITIHSVKIWNDLKKYSVTHDKTFNMSINFNIPDEFFGDYLRGFFDADGSIYFDKRRNGVYGRCSFVSASQKFLIDIHKKLGYGSFRSTHNGKYYALEISHSDALKLRDLMYKNNPNLKLDRKFNRFTTLSERRTCKAWTEEEIKIVKENIHLKRKEIIKLLPNRSLASLKHAITNLQKSKT